MIRRDLINLNTKTEKKKKKKNLISKICEEKRSNKLRSWLIRGTIIKCES